MLLVGYVVFSPFPSHPKSSHRDTETNPIKAMVTPVLVLAIIYSLTRSSTRAFAPHGALHCNFQFQSRLAAATNDDDDVVVVVVPQEGDGRGRRQKIRIDGAGWGRLSAAHALVTTDEQSSLEITVIDANPRAGGLVRDGYRSINGTHGGEAGQHGFWDNYFNIYELLESLPTILLIDDVLTGYAEQGHYTPRGLEAVWPVFRLTGGGGASLPTGLAQAMYTRFLNLPVLDRASALPLALAFCD